MLILCNLLDVKIKCDSSTTELKAFDIAKEFTSLERHLVLEFFVTKIEYSGLSTLNREALSF